MKTMSALFATALLAPLTALAASPFLPISPTNTFRSAERTAVETAIAQAEISGKRVFIDMAAAWCGPCLFLDKEIEAHKAELDPLLSKFIYLKLEEMHVESMNGADFLPHEMRWFPSLYVYDPANNKWSMLMAGDAAELKSELQDYLNNSNLSEFQWTRLQTKIKGGEKIDGGELMAVFVNRSIEASGAELLQAAKVVLDAITAKPDQFSFTLDDFEDRMNQAYTSAIEMGKLTVADIKAVDSKALPGSDSSGAFANRVAFDIEIGRILRTQGNKAASDQCAALSAAAAPLQKSAAPDVARRLNILRDLQCLMLKVQLKESSSADVSAYAAALTDDEKRKVPYALAKVFAMSGDFDQATTHLRLWKANYEKAYASRPELLARIQTATDQRIAAYAAGKTHP